MRVMKLATDLTDAQKNALAAKLGGTPDALNIIVHVGGAVLVLLDSKRQRVFRSANDLMGFINA